MTTKDKYKLADRALEHAMKNGASQARVIINNSQNNSISVREKKIENLEKSIENGLSIYLYVDNKYSVHSTNRLDKWKELARFIEEAIEGTKYLSEDKYRKLPDQSLYYKGGGPDLEIFDEEYDNIDPQQKIDVPFGIENEVAGKDERIVSVTSSYDDGMSEMVMVSSNGFRGDRTSTYYNLSASVSVKQGDARPSEGWYDNAIFYKDLKHVGIGKKALERALRKLGQSKIESGNMPMLIENRLAGQCLSPLIRALSGSAIQQKNSFLVDMINKKVGSDRLTLIDDPFIISARGSRLFDSEGLATKKRTIFENGVLHSYYLDTYYAGKLDMEPTGGSTTNLVMKEGERNLDELIASLDKGIFVTGFNGGNSNGSTGDFSYGIEGFLVEKGKLVKPVSEMNITGNFLKLYKNLAEVGNDAYEDSAWRTPSLLFDDVSFSGK